MALNDTSFPPSLSALLFLSPRFFAIISSIPIDRRYMLTIHLHNISIRVLTIRSFVKQEIIDVIWDLNSERSRRIFLLLINNLKRLSVSKKKKEKVSFRVSMYLYVSPVELAFCLILFFFFFLILKPITYLSISTCTFKWFIKFTQRLR